MSRNSERRGHAAALRVDRGHLRIARTGVNGLGVKFSWTYETGQHGGSWVLKTGSIVCGSVRKTLDADGRRAYDGEAQFGRRSTRWDRMKSLRQAQNAVETWVASVLEELDWKPCVT